MLTLLGRADGAAKAAADIMAFETALATKSRKLEDLRDPQKNYNKMTPADVTAKHTPSIVWTDRLAVVEPEARLRHRRAARVLHRARADAARRRPSRC